MCRAKNYTIALLVIICTFMTGCHTSGNPDSQESESVQFQSVDEYTSKEDQGYSVGNPRYEDEEPTAERNYDDPNNPLAEQTYRVGEPRYEDGEPVVEGCYDDPNNPLAEQTYRVGEPRYE